ncbi:hypothetical protein HYU89_00290 [Candidatus Collierbacteria bacterium]|nr:hypothetical protein [Candidatus Collierbacteria bacterium]
MAETRTGLFQFRTEVDSSGKARRVCKIEEPLLVGYYGLAKMEETAILFKVVDFALYL